ncbi:GNAT family N-acetyltransferase [Scandinavium sp. M-37]|uniref:GNAT family N-acetyltransferase n=1 Tax=Scandinavium sp. M-37 TaxID=3373077 RepID=UPI003745F88B
MQTHAPRLETERLVLRHFTVDDFDDLAAFWADPQVVKFIGGEPQSAEVSWSRLLRYIGHWQVLGYGYWAAFEKQSGRYVGSFGLQDARRDLTPALACPEAGWALTPTVHGMGYAKEALEAMLHWADRELGGPLCCIIDEDNLRSVHLAERFGFTYQHDVIYHGKPVRMFTRPAAR